MLDIDESAAQLVAHATKLCGSAGLAGKALRKAAKLSTPAADAASVDMAVSEAMETFGTVSVALVVSHTGYSTRKVRESLKRTAREVAQDTYTTA